jgi:hypothetical protein
VGASFLSVADFVPFFFDPFLLPPPFFFPPLPFFAFFPPDDLPFFFPGCSFE